MTDNIKLMIIQIIIIFTLLFIVIYLLRQKISIKYEQRIERYSINSIRKVSFSVFDKIKNKYFSLVKKMRKHFLKVSLFKRISKRYEKNLNYEYGDVKSIDYIIYKITISICFILLTIFSEVLQARVLTLFELVLNFLIGYYILDLYLIYERKLKIRQIENEMLRAIIIMNNAFKAGKSTLQAVEIAAKELPEPISKEFAKIQKDMEYGLTIDNVFQRFAKRVNIEEAVYLSSSLTILNKTGGNIVDVFSSIERTLFDKKKLKEELKNLTVSSNMIVKVLLFIPVAFVIIIYLLNPAYFNPLFESILGYMILGIIILMFVIYIFFLQKIMKVKV